ncbi:MAG: hypothetical protein KIT27_00495 [Legionellales bacterium]|nr:hypothetical protein [Legionellales bacterium]
MKISLNKDAINKLKHQIKLKSRLIYQFFKTAYQKLNKQQRIALSIVVGLIILLLIVIGLSSGSDIAKKSTSNNRYPVRFETQPLNKQQNKTVNPENSIIAANNAKFQAQLDQLKAISSAQYAAVKNQLQSIQSSMSSLASQQDVQQLKQNVSAPDEQLLGKVNSLQSSVQKIIKQTEKKTWVTPQSVERYFRLVAVQGFSDGMRTIIDVDGNQTTLSVEQICPACRGWALQSMNFSQQSAIFSKQVGNQILYVKLRAN